MEKPSEETLMFVVAAAVIFVIIILIVQILYSSGPGDIFNILKNFITLIFAYIFSKLNLILHG